MAESASPSSLSPNPSRTTTSSWLLTLTVTILAPVVAALLVYQLDSFEPAIIPSHELTREVQFVPLRNPRMLHGSERIGSGELQAPEDIEFDPESGVIYTGCVDGWIKRVTAKKSAADSVVESWVNTGGRPLGIVRGHQNDLIIADADKGLLRVAFEDGKIEVLADEAEGLKFGLTDAVDIADDGIIYFSDASYKYSFKEFVWDFLEGKPNGRLLSYDPSTKQTKVLIKDLYFANGVVVSPDQNFVIVCETPLRRCKRFYVKGEKKGSIDVFIEKMPGMPDNVRYDGEGHYWIAFSTELSYPWYVAQRYPLVRKVMAIMERYIGRPNVERNGGALAVDLEGKPKAYYHDPLLSLISSASKIGDHLYFGSIVNPYIIRLNVTQYPALPVH